MITGQTGLGFNPWHAVTNAAKKVGHGAETVGKDVGKGAKFIVKKTVLLPTEFAVEITKAATRLALRPVTSRIRTLENRRANKIAWDARKSRTPTTAERAQARSWTKSKLKGQLPHGPLLALLAGAPPVSSTQLGAFGMSTNLGVAPAVIAALIPVFMALMNSMLKSFSRSGEAPVAIGPNGMPVVPPGMDPTMVDPAAEAAANAGQDGPPDGGAGGGAIDAAGNDGGPMGPGGSGKPKGGLLLVGGLVAAVVIVGMLMKPSGKPAAKK